MENTTQLQSSGEPLEKSVSVSPLVIADWISSGFCLLLAGWTIVAPAFKVLPDRSGWPEIVLVIATTISAMISLSRSLPVQNVLLAAVMTGLLGGFVETLTALSALPFRSHVDVSQVGPRILGVMPWWIPLTWIIAILNSRGVARLILRPRRHARNYGFQLLGLTIVLSSVFETGFARSLMRTTRVTGPPEHGIVSIDLLFCAITALLILVAVIPVLINKKPVESPPDYHPLFLWALLNLVFLGSSIANHRWLETAVLGGSVLIGGAFAVRGARRSFDRPGR